MTRISLVLALGSLGACAHRDVSRALERSAIHAAFEAQLDAAERRVMAGEEPVVVEQPARADLAPATPVTDTDADAAQVAAETVVEEPTMPLSTDPQGLEGWRRLQSSSVGGGPELVRAIDDLRWTQILEARLADKQRLIDALEKRVDAGGVVPTGGNTSGLSARIDAIAASQQALVAAQAARDEEAKVAAEARVRAEADALAQREAAKAAKATEDAALADVLKGIQARLDALGTTPAPPAGPSEEMKAVQAALADLGSRIAALSAVQAAEREESRSFRLFGRRDREPTPKVIQAPVQPVVQADNAETERLRQRLADAEADRRATDADAADELESLNARLAAYEDDRARMESLQAELAKSGDEERLAQVESAMKALEGDRDKLSDLQTQVAGLAEERDRLERELADANAEQRSALLAEREAFEARTGALNQELRNLRQHQLEMEQKYSNRQEAVLARLKPLADSGIQVSLVGGDIRVDLRSDVLFSSGSATLSKDGFAPIEALATALEPFPELKVQVQGHTDDLPVKSTRFASNWDLAYARANAVLQVLLKSGLPADRTSAASFGDTRPVAANDTPAGREKNRRIELALELPPLEETP